MRRHRTTAGGQLWDVDGPEWKRTGDDLLALTIAAIGRVEELGKEGLFAAAWQRRCLTQGTNLQFARRVDGDSAAADLH